MSRSAELAEAAGWVRDVLSGPTALVIDGDAGIGKTTVWDATVEMSRTAGHHVLVARPAECEASASFAGLGDLLAGAEGAFAALPAPQRVALDAALCRGDIPDVPVERRAVALAFHGVVCELARSAPVILAVDDVQWLDASSGWVLRFASRRLASSTPAGLLLSCRTGSRAELVDDLDAHGGDVAVRHMTLGPLSLGALDEIVRRRLGDGLSRPALVRLHDDSDGNPLFALEVARVLLTAGHDVNADEPLPIPASLFAAIDARMASWTEEELHVLFAVAVLSEPTIDLVVSVFGPGAVAAIERAVDDRIIDRAARRIRFSHPLYASTAHARVNASGRRRVHAQLAVALRDSEEGARHLALSQDDTDAAVAEVLDRAAKRARTRGAPDRAAELFEQAVRLTPGAERERMGERSIGAADCYFALGDHQRATTLLAETVAVTPAGPIRADGLRLLGEIQGMGMHFRDSLPPLIEALQQPGIADLLRTEIELDIASASIGVGDLLGAAAHAEVALSAAENIAQPGLLAETIATSAFVAFLAGEGLDRDRMQRALTLEDYARQRPLALLPSLLWGLMLMWTGEVDASRHALEAVRRRLLDRGQDASLPIVLYFLIRLELARGGVDAALRYLDESNDAAAQGDNEIARLTYRQSQAEIDLHLGRLHSARSIAEELLPIGAEIGWLSAMVFQLATLATVALLEAKPAEVDSTVGHVVALIAALGLSEPSQAPFLGDEIEALVALGEVDRADELVTLLERRSHELERPGWLVVALRGQGMVASARGDVPAALAHLQRAVAAAEDLPTPIELGRTLLIKGEVERRAKRWSTARASLERAAAVFDGLGAQAWSCRAREELARVGGRPVTTLDLSATEHSVAELVALGQTNREVAEALHLSPKAVEANLTKIYRKVAVRSRAELAAQWGKT